MAIPSKSDRPGGGASMTVAADAGCSSLLLDFMDEEKGRHLFSFTFAFLLLLLLHLKFRRSRFCSSFHSTLLPEQIFGSQRGERERRAWGSLGGPNSEFH